MDAREDSVPRWFTAVAVALLVGFVALAAFAFRDTLMPAVAEKPTTDSRFAALAAAVRRAPDDSRARLELALALQQERRYSRALEQYALILRQQPGNTTALFNSGLCYEALERDASAEDAYLAVLAAQPDHIAAARALGELYLDAARFEEVIERVGDVADRRPDVGYLHYLVGAAYEGMGQAERATRRYRQAARAPGGSPEAVEALRRIDDQR